MSCAPSPEERIRARIDEGVAAAEARDLAKLNGFLSEDYSDPRGMDRQAVMARVALQLRGVDVLHCLARTRDVQITEPGRGAATVLLAVADIPISDPRALGRLRAELWSVDLEFVEESGEWRVVSADWRTASAQDFLF